MKVLQITLAATLLCCLPVVRAQSANLDLVFIVDGSGSIDAADWDLQKKGISTAIKNPALIPLDGSIALAVVQFSTPAPRTEVPYRIIRNQTDLMAVDNAVLGMVQIGSSTNPGDGIAAATALLTPTYRATANQTYCMSTDGLINSGVDTRTALNAAKNSTFQLERFGVIAIEDGPGALEANFQAAYGPLVFGGGAVFVVRNTAEFASSVGFVCFPNIATELVGLEVVQVSQDLTNSVALVQDKSTLVRAYVQPVDPSKSGRIQVRLRGRRGGVELAGSPLTPTSPGGILVKAKALDRRNILGDSFNFRIPESWRSGTVEFEVQGVGTSLKCLEKAGPTQNDCKATITFQAVPRLQVKFIGIRYESPPGTVVKTSASDLTELQNRLLSIYPVSRIDRTTGYLDMGIGIPDSEAVNSRLESMRVLDGCISFLGCDRLYYGAVNQGGSLKYRSGTTGGLANDIPGTVSCGVIEDGNAYGRNRHAHEIAHTMGASHAVTTNVKDGKRGVCNEFAASTAPIFPFVETVAGSQRATIGPLSQGADKIVFGWDSYRNQIINPTTDFELMSYCKTSRWISTFTYSTVRSYITSNFRRRQLKRRELRASRILQTTNYTVIRAIVDMNTTTTTFLPALQVVLPTVPAVSSNEFQVVGLNGAGGEMFRVAFEPIRYFQDLLSPDDMPILTNSMYVQAFVPKSTTGMVASIQVAQNRSIVGNAKSISANAPTVSVIYPNGGESLNGATTTISWSSTDPDGDTLTYFVLFSPDAGVTWKTLTADHTATSLEVPLDTLGQTRFGLIRVQASDGFNTGEDVSDATFITPNIPPEVQIVSPSNGDFFEGVQLVLFQASTNDAEDGVVADSRLRWTSNIDGFLGSGATLNVEASKLTEKNHTITLEGSDSSGAKTSASVNITIYRIAPIQNTTTPSPTASPIKPPIKPPINPPVKAPTGSPIKTPTKSPVAKCRIGLFNVLCFFQNIFKWLINIFRRG